MKKEGKYCGECCWFYGENTDGYGFCAIRKGELTEYMHCGDICNDANGNIFVSRQKMRHYIAVLLQRLRFQQDDSGYSFKRKRKYPFGVFDAIEFAYKYMKVFSNL